MTRSDYENMNIEELHVHLSLIRAVLRKHEPAYKNEAQDEKFKNIFLDSLMRLKNEQTVDNVLNFYFDCNCVGYAVYPTRSEVKEMISKVF